ncbi:MAG: TlyA family rRNA (cytidine-2'-O)-methyltransferase [Alphaproteobacteria bacterium]|nr:TlyA family rRNA (cytidine-2'-O)-methyltransferase [Alphaproteobacteria bacterium]
MTRKRADVVLVERGLAASRAQAQAAIVAGGVTADGAAIAKPSDMVDPDADLSFTPAHPWASRGGLKLIAALDAFRVDPAGRVSLDIGASTGGFTDVLLSRGAAKVFSVDVGTGQMIDALRNDPRVVVLEKTDARALTRAMIPEAPSLIVCDVSFIGLEKALPVALSLAAPEAELIALVKPQFEAGPGAGGKSGVLEEAVARNAAGAAIAALDGLEGFFVQGFCDSPIKGGDGNLELLVYARRG